MKRKAQQGLVGAFIAVLVAVIVGVGIVIPVITDTIENASITGMTATILNYLPILLAVVLLVAIAGLISMR